MADLLAFGRVTDWQTAVHEQGAQLAAIQRRTANIAGLRSGLGEFFTYCAMWLVLWLAWDVRVDPTTLLDRPADQIGALLTLALWNTTLTQFLWIGGLAAVPDITRGSYLFFLKPVIAAWLALAFLGQAVTWMQWLAIAVVCSSVAIEAGWNPLAARLRARRR